MIFKSVTQLSWQLNNYKILCFNILFSAWSLVNKTLAPLLTKVEPPQVPARTKKLKLNQDRGLKIQEQDKNQVNLNHDKNSTHGTYLQHAALSFENCQKAILF